MAKAKVTHSADSAQITFRGDKRRPEPSTAIIKFPGGSVEVTRTSDDEYWAHVAIDAAGHGLHMPDDPVGVIVDSRIDYDHEGYKKAEGAIPPIPLAEHVQHMAIKVRPVRGKGEGAES